MFKEADRFGVDKRDLVAAILAAGAAVGIATVLNLQDGGISNLGRPSGNFEPQTMSVPVSNSAFRK